MSRIVHLKFMDDIELIFLNLAQKQTPAGCRRRRTSCKDVSLHSQPASQDISLQILESNQKYKFHKLSKKLLRFCEVSLSASLQAERSPVDLGEEAIRERRQLGRGELGTL
ncbi:unnamed protein product [Meganyctiphanes norvegica]|uniref:Uncharacterized protein n=1 Tax=Meganyctiphanes norvegica TaxID=48144 RepID=A0AAV2PTQ9_MEGNR